MDEQKVRDIVQNLLLMDSVWDFKICAFSEVSKYLTDELCKDFASPTTAGILHCLDESMAKWIALVYFIPRPYEEMPKAYSNYTQELIAACESIRVYLSSTDDRQPDSDFDTEAELQRNITAVVESNTREGQVETPSTGLVMRLCIILETAYRVIMGNALYERFHSDRNRARGICNEYIKLIKSSENASAH
jgi:hypothetical protein